MTFVTTYLLDAKAMKFLKIKDSYSLHRAVYALFERIDKNNSLESGRILYADKGRTRQGNVVVILSDRLPKIPQYGRVDSREITDEFFSASLYRFEIIVNPVRRESKSRKLIPVLGNEAIAQWFKAKAASCGIGLLPGNFDVNDISVDTFEKREGTVTLQKAHIAGVLSVHNKDLFRTAVCTGMGHGKAFGCGLLQVAPLTF